MTGGVVIRPAGPADAEGIAAVYAPHVLSGTASYEMDPPDAGEMARRLAEVAGRGLPWLVAADAGGKILGYAYASPFRLRPAYRYLVENSVYLSPSAAGRGLGTALLRAVIDHCTAAGYRRMVAVIGDAGNAASVALHRKLGFQVVGTVPGAGFKHGRWLTWMMMQRPLGDGDDCLPPVDGP